MSRLVAVALALLANPCLGQISLESVLEGFESEETEANAGEFDNNPTESVNYPFPSERSELDEIFSGFDEQRLSGVASDSNFAGKIPGWLRLSGTLSQEFSVNISNDAPVDGGMDRRGLASARTRLDFSADAKLDGDYRARLTGNIQIGPLYLRRADQDAKGAATDIRDFEIELGEAFFRGPLSGSADLAFGRQIVVWGRSDQFRVNDILNPVDNRTPGMTDIENLRLPVTMARLEIYGGP